MKYISPFVASALACLFSASSLAQTGEETVVLLPEGAELPDVVTAAIDLPRDTAGAYRPSAQAVESSAKGLATANAAREDGRAFGAQMAANAADNRETHARGARPDLSDLLPDQVPDHVTPPSLPEVPAAPTETPVGPPETPVIPPVSPPVTPPGRP
ncbi:MAG TPA: hypothetical protein VGL98_01020 [Gammaproteobacteria bacterium]